MEVILIEEVYKLGNPGEIVNVKRGYARNFLFPQRLAVRKSPHALKLVEKQRESYEQKIVEKNKSYKAILEQIEQVSEFKIEMTATKEGKLFGSITPSLISKYLKENFNLDLDKKFIIIRESIKSLGEYEFEVVFKSDLKTKLEVKIVSDSQS